MHATRAGHRMHQVADPIIPVLGGLIAAHPGTISLGQGMVAFGPPPEALDAVARRVHEPEVQRYQGGDGLPALVERLSAKLARENAIEPRGRRVMVTAGANMAFLQVMIAVLDPGDEVIIPEPFYFNYPMAVTMAGGRTVSVPTDEHYQLDVAAIARAITPRTRAVVTISPNNPTGAVYQPEVLAEVNALCARHGLYHVSDEVYEYFAFGSTPHVSPASLPGSDGHTITLNSFSKAFGMAGWRVGYVSVPEALAPALIKVQDTNLVCPPVLSQHLALAVLDAPRHYVREQIAHVGARRRLAEACLRGLPHACRVAPTEGALYLFVRVHSGLSPMALTERLIREHRVAVVPGDAFGESRGCTLRVAYGAVTDDQAAEGLERLARGLEALAD